MRECFKDMYVLNGELQDISNFDNDILSKEKVVYEVIRLINGKPFGVQDNFKRLRRSLRLTEIDFAIDEEQLLNEIELLATKNNVKTGNVKYLIYKGNNISNRVLYLIRHHYPSEKKLKEGVKTLSLKEERRNPMAKVINKELRQKANSIIEKKNVFEMILVDNNGYICEGSRSNIFFVKEDKIYTAPNYKILPGTSREKVIHICEKHHIEIINECISFSDISNYDSAFLTSTSMSVLPISYIDDVSFNVNNNLVQKIQNEYLKLLQTPQ